MDLVGAEAEAELDRRRDAAAVRDAARLRLLRFGAGAKALEPLEGLWPTYRAAAMASAEDKRTIVVITHGQGAPDISHL